MIIHKLKRGYQYTLIFPNHTVLFKDKRKWYIILYGTRMIRIHAVIGRYLYLVVFKGKMYL